MFSIGTAMYHDDRRSRGLDCGAGDTISASRDIASVRRLLQQSNELIDNIAALSDKRAVLNPLPGSLRKRHMRCGKGSCRCRSGALHGPYYYFEPSRQHGKWRYVPKNGSAKCGRALQIGKSNGKSMKCSKRARKSLTRL